MAHLSIGYNAQCKSPTIIRRQHPEYLAVSGAIGADHAEAASSSV
jgi:hypothetical protein